jgi:hypothetical protein
VPTRPKLSSSTTERLRERSASRAADERSTRERPPSYSVNNCYVPSYEYGNYNRWNPSPFYQPYNPYRPYSLNWWLDLRPINPFDRLVRDEQVRAE